MTDASGRLEGRIALVTGASRGIGAAITRQALAHGARVALVARGEQVDALAASLGDAALPIRADVSDPEAADAAVATTLAAFGRLDVVVNNAGLHRGGKAKRLAQDSWQQVLDVNLTGPLNIVRAAIPALEVRGGSIVNIGAVVGFRGFPGDVAYASSKAGLSGMTKALAIELAKKEITVNLVIPGLVLTDMTSELTEAAMASMTAQIPMGRMGAEHEIAEVVYWVSQSRYMTGAAIPVEGGLLSSFGVIAE